MHIQREMVATVVSRYGVTSVSANQFFISWNSVATLAYTGFSRTLLALKQGIEQSIPGLKQENPGSRWPKTTLGCLRDAVELTEQQVRDLRSICVQKSAELQGLAESERSLGVRELSCVTFHCRTLERRLASLVVPLQGCALTHDEPPVPHLESVAKTMAEFSEEQHDKYYPRLAPNGRTIDGYYRAPHIESTLVYDLHASVPLADCIASFRKAVNKELPNRYAWFDPSSWHMTVRALVADDATRRA
jgi:hypothetical protein